MKPEEAIERAAGMMAFTGILMLLMFGAWLVSLVDVIKSDFRNQSNKTVWILLLIFIPPLGIILYQFIGKGQKIDSPNRLQDWKNKF